MWSGPDHVVTRLSADAFRCVILSRGNDVRDLSNRGTSELTFLVLSVKRSTFMMLHIYKENRTPFQQIS